MAAKGATVVGKDDLVHQTAAKAGTNLKETNEIIDAFTEVVREQVSKGKEVRLMGFGTWNLRNVAARKVKSIRGGQQIHVTWNMPHSPLTIPLLLHPTSY